MKKLLTLFFCIPALLSFAQEVDFPQPVFKRYTVTEGLPSPEIYDVIQDHYGYIWIATDRGVSRFDGRTFRNFGTENGLTDNTVFNLHEDAQGRLWCLTFNGRLCWIRNDSIVPYRYNDLLQKQLVSPHILRSFSVEKNDSIVLGYLKHGICAVSGSGVFSNLFPPPGAGQNIQYQAVVSGGQVHLGQHRNGAHQDTHELLVRINGQSTRLPMNHYQAQENIYGFRRKNGEYIFAMEKTLFSNRGGKFTSRKSDEEIVRMYEDRDSCLWLSAPGKGVKRFAPGADSGTCDLFFREETITAILHDHEGGFWLGTLGHGLFYIPSLAMRNFVPAKATYDREVRVMAMHGDGILAGFGNGMIGLANDTGMTVLKFAGDRNLFRMPMSLLHDTRLGWTWISDRQQLFAFDETGKACTDSSLKLALCLASDREGNTWSCGNGYIARYEKNASKTWTIHERFHYIVFDDENRCWVASLRGIFIFRNGVLERPPFYASLPDARISEILPLPGGGLALGGLGCGLIVVRDDKIVRIGENEGLSGNTVNCLAAASDGWLWAGTNRGLSGIQFRETGSVIRNFSTAHGLPTNDIHKLIARDGVLWLGSSEGLTRFNPTLSPQNIIPPRIYITRIHTRDSIYLPGRKPEFPYHDNNLNILFTGLSYRMSGDVVFRYRLNDRNDSWQVVRSPSVQLASLEPGDYTFEVQAQNEDGAWSEKPAVFHFRIRPPYWKTWWFITLTGSLVLFFAALFYRRRIRMIRYRDTMQRLLSEYRRQALAAQMNPHFIFNALNSIQTFILKNDRVSATRYLSMFAQLMREVLDNSQSVHITVERELEALRLYLQLEQLRFPDKLRYEIKTEGFSTSELLIPALLLQPFVENAIRHGIAPKEEGGTVLVLLSKKENGILCVIEDDGKGRAASRKQETGGHRSSGSELTEKRIRHDAEQADIPAEFLVEDIVSPGGQPCGTRVSFRVAIRQAKKETNNINQPT
ncbi:MAG: putative signal transduction histidine kinase [Bacteroidetes bacterium]|nr:MAG: putative signal transduction histidine kinase [Bacteroidota bacterium]